MTKQTEVPEEEGGEINKQELGQGCEKPITKGNDRSDVKETHGGSEWKSNACMIQGQTGLRGAVMC